MVRVIQPDEKQEAITDFKNKEIFEQILQTMPTSLAKIIGQAKFNQWGEAQIPEKTALHLWAKDNPNVAKTYLKAWKHVRDIKARTVRNADKWAKNIKQRNAQANIVALEQCMRSIDPPTRSNAVCYSIKATVPGHEHVVVKGYGWRSPEFRIKVPLTYFKNVEGKQNMFHLATENGKKWVNFITRYNPIKPLQDGVMAFKCEVERFCPDNHEQEHVVGYFMQQEFDGEEVNGFGYTEKRALSLMNKRLKAMMLEKLGVA
jgi:hypothetical protein